VPVITEIKVPAARPCRGHHKDWKGSSRFAVTSLQQQPDTRSLRTSHVQKRGVFKCSISRSSVLDTLGVEQMFFCTRRF
jgi:hypothetical protein